MGAWERGLIVCWNLVHIGILLVPPSRNYEKSPFISLGKIMKGF